MGKDLGCVHEPISRELKSAEEESYRLGIQTRVFRCLLGVLVSAFRRLCVPVPVCPVSLGCEIWIKRKLRFSRWSSTKKLTKLHSTDENQNASYPSYETPRDLNTSTCINIYETQGFIDYTKQPLHLRIGAFIHLHRQL